eukprot:349230-Rhodomonas_salina.1
MRNQRQETAIPYTLDRKGGPSGSNTCPAFACTSGTPGEACMPEQGGDEEEGGRRICSGFRSKVKSVQNQGQILRGTDLDCVFVCNQRVVVPGEHADGTQMP